MPLGGRAARKIESGVASTLDPYGPRLSQMAEPNARKADQAYCIKTGIKGCAWPGNTAAADPATTTIVNNRRDLRTTGIKDDAVGDAVGITWGKDSYSRNFRVPVRTGRYLPLVKDRRRGMRNPVNLVRLISFT